LARSVKPKKIPEWLSDRSLVFPHRKGHICVWLCSVCGAPYFYFPDGKTHGGPERGIDPRYSREFEGPCWKSIEYGVKCATPKGKRVLIHRGVPNPPQPDQPDLEGIQRIIETRGGRRPGKGQQRTERRAR
jgi:hypothetical protein